MARSRRDMAGSRTDLQAGWGRRPDRRWRGPRCQWRRLRFVHGHPYEVRQGASVLPLHRVRLADGQVARSLPTDAVQWFYNEHVLGLKFLTTAPRIP